KLDQHLSMFAADSAANLHKTLPAPDNRARNIRAAREFDRSEQFTSFEQGPRHARGFLRVTGWKATESAMNSFTALVFRRSTQQSALSTSAKFFLSLAAMVALTGCAVFSPKVDLKKIPVVSIEASQVNGPGIAPGDKSPLVVTVTDAKGK